VLLTSSSWPLKLDSSNTDKPLALAYTLLLMRKFARPRPSAMPMPAVRPEVGIVHLEMVDFAGGRVDAQRVQPVAVVAPFAPAQLVVIEHARG